MEVTRKRSNSTSNSISAKRNKLSSELDGGYWKRPATRRKVALGNRFQQETRGKEPPAENSLIVHPTFNVGLPVVFGQQQEVEQQTVIDEEELEQPFAALRRLGVILNTENTVLQADEVEEPSSPPPSPVRRTPLQIRSSGSIETAVTRNLPEEPSYVWNFVPSWETFRVGARILARTLTFPLSVFNFLVDVAPETRQRARQIEAAQRELELLQIQQARPPSEDLSPLSSLPPSPSASVTSPSDHTMASAGSGGRGGSGGPGGSGNPLNNTPNPPEDGESAMLRRMQEMLDAQLARLRTEFAQANNPLDPVARDNALATERRNLEAKMAAVDAERGLIQQGRWEGPTTPLAPTSIYVAPASVPTNPPRQAQPRFNPNDLPQILFGEDVEEWLAIMDHVVGSFGELIVCPHILPRCFAPGDPIRDWYLTKPAATHTYVTTGDGCWERFKRVFRARFKPDVGTLQFEADGYRKAPGETWAAFGIKKLRLLQRAYAGAEDANIILKIKSTMDTEVQRFCKEKTDIDAFIGELMDFDRTNSSVIAGPSSSRNVFDRVDSPARSQTSPRGTSNRHESGRYEPRNQRADKGKGKATDTDDRISTIQR
jgi:hypothetical protein